MPTALQRSVAAHRIRWGAPDVVARAPGRVNLIGEHTDYNDGFAMPMALPFDTVVAASATGDDEQGGPVTVASEGFGELTIDPTADPRDTTGWGRLVAGVVAIVRGQGVAAGGWRATIATDIPTGASLSSSAALEIAIITYLFARAGRIAAPIELAQLGQRVENEVIGLPSGIMDQFISAGAVAGHASLMDCRALTLTPSPLPHDGVIAIMDTGTRRELAEAAYGERRAACERAVATLGIRALRDATIASLDAIDDPVVRRRARHVVTENARTLAAREAMERGDLDELGRLMTESHVSLRDDYEVSGPGLDRIVEVALASRGCLGARMTGGGFAGCAVALVRAQDSEAFADDVVAGYEFDGHRALVWMCAPSAGAGLVDPAAMPV